ncbi:hypothetical protein V2J09_008665 [Rumex salicifolius]
MEIAVIPDTFQFLAKHLVDRALSSNHLSVAAAGNIQISVLLSAVDVVASPPVRSTTIRMPARALRKRRLCRTRRRRPSSGGSEEDSLFGGGGDDGPFDGSGGGGGWNSDGFSGFGWDDSSSSPADPAFDFVYEVVCWLVFSNCLHFAYKKVVRLLTAGCADDGREKVPLPRDFSPRGRSTIKWEKQAATKRTDNSLGSGGVSLSKSQAKVAGLAATV